MALANRGRILRAMDSTGSVRDIEALARGVLAPYEFLVQATKLIAQRVAFEDFYFTAVDPDSTLPTWSACRDRVPTPLLARWIKLEMAEAAGGIADIARSRGTVVRSPENAPPRACTARYREILRPLDLEHEVRVVFRDRGTTWGVLGLLRTAGQRDFCPEEGELLEEMAAPFAQGLRRTHLWIPTANDPLDERPAVIVLTSDVRVVSCTEAAEKLLLELKGIARPDPERLPLAVQAVALQVSGQPAASGGVSSRARTRSGQWVTIRGAPLDAEDRIVIVLERAPRNDVTAVILAAHGLTSRERKVAQHVLLGLSSQDVSEVLGISPYTVQDHLKAVFDKTGVSSRKELAARLFASVAA
jgi:DNA-binding CsgD family transcriptional regulator